MAVVWLRDGEIVVEPLVADRPEPEMPQDPG
jgi:hypothetical protein